VGEAAQRTRREPVSRRATGAGSRQATQPKPRPRQRSNHSQPQYQVALRDTQSCAEVSISELAYEVIERECIRFARFDDVETGGLLAGPGEGSDTAWPWSTSGCGEFAGSRAAPQSPVSARQVPAQ